MHLVHWFRRIGLYVVRRTPAGYVFGFAVRYAPWLLPVRRLMQTNEVLALAHPVPLVPGHLVILPRAAVRDLPALAKPRNVPFFRAVLEAALALGDRTPGTWTMIVNGGTAQEVAHVHFHFLPNYGTEHGGGPFKPVETMHSLPVAEHEACRKYRAHLRIDLRGEDRAALTNPELLGDALDILRELIEQLMAANRWYTVLIQPSTVAAISGLSFHLGVGRK